MMGNNCLMIQNPIPNVSMMRVQGDPNQNCSFLKVITLKQSTSDPMLINPKQGQKCIVLELQPLEKGNFDLGHPVVRREMPIFALNTYAL